MVRKQFAILNGWKEIATYLGKGVRTVQRYERELALPIHRPAGKSQGSVLAIKAEIERWVNSSPVRPVSMPKSWPGEQTNRLRAEFLQIDCEIALTFSSIAAQASDERKRRRAAQTARKAYETIVRLRKGIELTDPQAQKLDRGLQRLKSELQNLSQYF